MEALLPRAGGLVERRQALVEKQQEHWEDPKVEMLLGAQGVQTEQQGHPKMV